MLLIQTGRDVTSTGKSPSVGIVKQLPPAEQPTGPVDSWLSHIASEVLVIEGGIFEILPLRNFF